MRAAVVHHYGSPDVVHIEELPKPEPKPGEVLIRVRATTVSSGDWRVRSLDVPKGFKLITRLVFGWSGPRQRVLGTELAGVIEAVGPGATGFDVGDEVFGACGMSMGAHAEYKCLPANGAIARKPEALSFEEAAALCFGPGTALLYLQRGKVKAGERVLINGASGAVGSALVQLAKHMGAHVTAVCSGGNRPLVEQLGADEIIDYTQEDFTKNGRTYDVIIDTAGTAPYSRCRHSLTPEGRLLLVLADLPAILQAPWAALTSRQRVLAGPVEPTKQDVEALAELARSGVLRPVIGERYPLERIVDAHRLVDTGHKRGSVVVAL